MKFLSFITFFLKNNETISKIFGAAPTAYKVALERSTTGLAKLIEDCIKVYDPSKHGKAKEAVEQAFESINVAFTEIKKVYPDFQPFVQKHAAYVKKGMRDIFDNVKDEIDTVKNNAVIDGLIIDVTAERWAKAEIWLSEMSKDHTFITFGHVMDLRTVLYMLREHGCGVNVQNIPNFRYPVSVKTVLVTDETDQEFEFYQCDNKHLVILAPAQ